jgi:hypothetical protein
MCRWWAIRKSGLASTRGIPTWRRTWLLCATRGRLLRDLPDAYGMQIDVERLEVDEEATKTEVQWRGRLVRLPPGSQYGSIFHREDGQTFTYDTMEDALQQPLQDYLSLGHRIEIWAKYQAANGHLTITRAQIVPAGTN